MAREFYAGPGLNIETYGLRANPSNDASPVAGDIAFYLRQASDQGGELLELGCGEGRVAIPLARAGVRVTGLDRSEAMLAASRAKLAGEPPEVQERLSFVLGDMSDFELGCQFRLIIIPFRAFQMLLTPELERACLEACYRHLSPGGQLIVDLFDPLLELLTPGEVEPDSTRHVARLGDGRTVTTETIARRNDTLAQVLTETWRFTERDAAGEVVRQEEETLRLRWLYRYEAQYLFEIAGFEVVAEYSDFTGSPPAYGKEQVWVLRRPLA